MNARAFAAAALAVALTGCATFAEERRWLGEHARRALGEYLDARIEVRRARRWCGVIEDACPAEVSPTPRSREPRP